MTSYIIRRLLLGVVVLLVVSVLIFSLMRLLPGDPLLLYVGPEYNSYSPEQIVKLKHEWGLDKPVVLQYFDWLGGTLHGDLGKSIVNQQKVSTLIAQRLPVTFNVGILSLMISCIFGVTFGVICAIKRGEWEDTTLSVTANLGITLPNFWVGILLIYWLSLKLGLLPTYGYTSPFENLSMNIKMLIMPVFCLSIQQIAGLTRQTRSSILEVTRQDYIRTAWAKGLRERAIVIHHMIKNGLIPVVTTMGMHVSHLFGGAVLITALVVVLTNILVDIIYGWLDPRIRYD
jgi:peptide/nickel transport system permease protein